MSRLKSCRASCKARFLPKEAWGQQNWRSTLCQTIQRTYQTMQTSFLRRRLDLKRLEFDQSLDLLQCKSLFLKDPTTLLSTWPSKRDLGENKHLGNSRANLWLEENKINWISALVKWHQALQNHWHFVLKFWSGSWTNWKLHHFQISGFHPLCTHCY